MYCFETTKNISRKKTTRTKTQMVNAKYCTSCSIIGLRKNLKLDQNVSLLFFFIIKKFYTFKHPRFGTYSFPSIKIF